jgi:hypothetical protein
MQREGIAMALVGYLPAAWHRSCDAANAELFRILSPHANVLVPVPAVNPAWPGWRRELELYAAQGAPALRVYPPQWGSGFGAHHLRELSQEAASRGMAVILTSRFEDLRQRHWMDSAGDLDAGMVRSIARVEDGANVILTCAGRGMIEEVHWSLTPDERKRIWYDISWIWGPPQHDLAHLLRTIGASRFLYGTMWPLRLAQTPASNLDLLPGDLAGSPLGDARAAIPLLVSRAP